MFFVEMLRKSPKNALYKFIQFHDDTNVLPYFKNSSVTYFNNMNNKKNIPAIKYIFHIFFLIAMIRNDFYVI